jgi:hypothetical protein
VIADEWRAAQDWPHLQRARNRAVRRSKQGRVPPGAGTKLRSAPPTDRFHVSLRESAVRSVRRTVHTVIGATARITRPPHRGVLPGAARFCPLENIGSSDDGGEPRAWSRSNVGGSDVRTEQINRAHRRRADAGSVAST